MIAIADLTDDELRQAVRGLRLAGFVPEAEFYDQVVAFGKNTATVVDLTGAVNPVAERFFEAARERLLNIDITAATGG